ncbi:hypothetical protein [Corynebacterium sp.]|uniref:hypothetical protein n=1 Tax=Corynebacterium sp. TaxID=1720 RepID=UPI002619B277|nr:hypothetical protein [Corynebacterium sp.]
MATIISVWALRESSRASREVQQLELRRQELDEKLHVQRFNFDQQRTEWERKASEAARQQQAHFQTMQSQWQEEAAERDEERRKRQAVAGVSSWWACKSENGSNKWGLVIVNEGPYAGPVTELNIDARSQFGMENFTLNFLPPGQYFVENKKNDRYTWGFPEIITPSASISPVTKSKKYAVESLRCRDPLNNSWCWTPTSGWQNAKD